MGIRILGIFPFLEDLIKALEAAREAGWGIETVYSPTPDPALEDAMRWKPSPVRLYVLLIGAAAFAGGLALCAYSAAAWDLIVWGKPVLAWIPFFLIAYEFTVIAAVITNLVCVVTMGKKDFLARYHDDRFSTDHFGLLVLAPEEDRDRVAALFREKGAEEVRS